MAEKVSVPYHASVPAVTEGTAVAFTVPGGQRFRLREVETVFPSGAAGDLQLAVYHGIRKVAPKDGVFRMSQGKQVARVEYTFISGEKVLVWYKNTHATEAKDGDLLLEGELE